MNVYRIDFSLSATAYIRAASEEDAKRIASEKTQSDLILSTGGDISGARFDDPNLPDFSFSPAMTINDADIAGVELVHDDNCKFDERD